MDTTYNAGGTFIILVIILVILIYYINIILVILDPELRGRSTGSMVTDFVLGIPFSDKILVKLLSLTILVKQLSL